MKYNLHYKDNLQHELFYYPFTWKIWHIVCLTLAVLFVCFLLGTTCLRRVGFDQGQAIGQTNGRV